MASKDEVDNTCPPPAGMTKPKTPYFKSEIRLSKPAVFTQ